MILLLLSLAQQLHALLLPLTLNERLQLLRLDLVPGSLAFLCLQLHLSGLNHVLEDLDFAVSLTEHLLVGRHLLGFEFVEALLRGFKRNLEGFILGHELADSFQTFF